MSKDYQVGIYLRLSKEDEKLGESGSITNQRAILMDYITKHELEFVSEYVDDGVSGTTFNRVGFNQMLIDIENKKINMIITKDTSRLGRDHIEFGYYVEKYFPEHNVRYVAVCDNIDTFYNNNDMLLFKSAYNDMYVKDISNKIRASLNIKKRNGEFVGAYAPYGYVKDSNDKHKLLIDERAARVVKRIFSLFIEGNSITRIAAILTDEEEPIPSIYKNMNRGVKSKLFGVWTNRTITDILTNPTYMGDLTQGRSRKVNYKSKKRIHTKKEDWIITRNSCPSIIDENTFKYVQSMYEVNKNKQNNNTDILLKGLVYCKECNHTIGFRVVNTKDKRLIYGNCNYYLKKKRYQGCTPHSIKYYELESIILDKVKTLSYGIDKNTVRSWLQERFDASDEAKRIKKEMKLLESSILLEEKKMDNLYEDKLSNFITEERYLRVEKNIREKINKLEEQLKELNINKNTDNKLNYLDYFDSIFDSYLRSKIFISSLINKILVSEEGKIDIYFNIVKS